MPKHFPATKRAFLNQSDLLPVYNLIWVEDVTQSNAACVGYLKCVLIYENLCIINAALDKDKLQCLVQVPWKWQTMFWSVSSSRLKNCTSNLGLGALKQFENPRFKPPNDAWLPFAAVRIVNFKVPCEPHGYDWHKMSWNCAQGGKKNEKHYSSPQSLSSK